MAENTKPAGRGLKSDPQHPWRHHNLGRLLLVGMVNWQDILVSGLQDKGFRRFRASHMSLLRHIDLDGTRMTEIAQRARLTKQTVSQALAACEAEKLVETVADPTDRRARIVKFTRLGEAVIVAEREVMERIDVELRKALGEAGLESLRQSLAFLATWPGPYGRRTREKGAARARPASRSRRGPPRQARSATR